MGTYENVKQVCDLISRLNSPSFFAEWLKEEMTGSIDDDVNPLTGKENEINEILKKSGTFGVQGPTKSGSYDKEGKWVEFIALTQTFNKDAPELKNFLNEMSKSFIIEKKKDGSLNVIDSSDKKSPILIDIANYIVASDDTYALNLTTKKVMDLKAHQKGSASKTDYGVIVELNIEVQPTVSSIADKLILLKLPDDTTQKEKIVSTLNSEVVEILEKQDCNGLLKNQKIEEERTKAIEAFELLDSDFEEFIKD